MSPDVAWEYEVARLTALRHAKGLTQIQLGEALGASPVSIHDWETGKRVPMILSWLRWRAYLGLPAPWETGSTKRREKWRDGVRKRRRSD